MTFWWRVVKFFPMRFSTWSSRFPPLGGLICPYKKKKVSKSQTVELFSILFFFITFGLEWISGLFYLPKFEDGSVWTFFGSINFWQHLDWYGLGYKLGYGFKYWFIDCINLEHNRIGLANWIRLYFYYRRHFESVHNGNNMI